MTITVDPFLFQELLEIGTLELVDAGRDDGFVGERSQILCDVLALAAATDAVDDRYSRRARLGQERLDLRNRGDAARPALHVAGLVVEIEHQKRRRFPVDRDRFQRGRGRCLHRRPFVDDCLGLHAVESGIARDTCDYCKAADNQTASRWHLCSPVDCVNGHWYTHLFLIVYDRQREITDEASPT